MISNTSDTRIAEIRAVTPPAIIINEYPSDSQIIELVRTTRRNISQILHGKDSRLLAIVGPCSVHDPDGILAYGEKLCRLRKELHSDLEIVMRVYFEKPRTTIGWKGLINDPDLDGSFDVNKGLRLVRKLLVELNRTGLPAATEFLDIVTGQYYADLISWGAIGARTTESQVHRELASGLSCPVGFKNGTDGNLQIALDAVNAAHHPHIFLSPTFEGQMAIYKTKGNADAHIILRGGQYPNYNTESVATSIAAMQSVNIKTGLIIDFSHANSSNAHKKQLTVGQDVADQIKGGQAKIVGCMIESNLIEGRQDVVAGQPLVYGKSITDACIGWPDTESLLCALAEAVKYRFQ